MNGSGCQFFHYSICPSYSQLASKLTLLTGGTSSSSVDRTDRARCRPPMRSNQEVLDPGATHWFQLLVFTDTTRYHHLIFGYDWHSSKAGVLHL